jgi:hypothetical protein
MPVASQTQAKSRFLVVLVENRRFEIYHGHTSENASWEAQSRNPRQPGSRPFENIQFRESDKYAVAQLDTLGSRLCAPETAKPSTPALGLSTAALGQSTVSVSEKSETPKPHGVTKEVADEFAWIAHLLSPQRSGLYDELQTLITMNILQIHPVSGIPVLADDWVGKMDVFVLEELDTAWGTTADPDGKYCIHDELVDALEEYWVKSSYGWALAEDPDDLIFDLEELDEWRQSFEGKLDAKENYSVGIGRFGI